ncbi:MAG: ABC transporter substrate-binding protein [Defluviitaleaceae bacterium]|nr:ABC transporter substrate-binding protein [Defluviitaleaceae bacterium]MCL2238906.1 ABC transporter substrate-binding protein [Defluviitaleaceae bacterium]MCL2239418.1 ABC transporter substrate-binding protein [Defluviitaleaceae bacterium]
MWYKKLLILIPLLFIVACGTTDDEYTQVTLVLDWTPNTNHTGFFVAMERGYFAEEGIQLEIIQPPEDGAILLVAAGHAQFGISFQEELLLAANSPHAPIPVSAIAALASYNTSGILSLAEHNITRFRDLEGATFGSWMIPLFDEIVRESVRMDGGNPDLVTFVPHMALDNITGIEREFDATWVFEGWDLVMAGEMGMDTNFFLFRDVNPVFDYYTPVLIAHNDDLDSTLTQRFMRASARGFAFARDNYAQAAEILHRHAPEMDLDILTASQRFLSGVYFGANRWGYIDTNRWNAFFYWMRDHEFIPANAQYRAFLNISQ